MGFGQVEENIGKWQIDFCNLGMRRFHLDNVASLQTTSLLKSPASLLECVLRYIGIPMPNIEKY